MSVSQNGWRVLEARFDGAYPRLRVTRIPTGDDLAERHLILRDGSAAFLLAHFALWFHDRVERLDLGTWDEWGYANRAVRGSTAVISNHASGTAMDLNATRHPLGVATLHTFTPPQVDAIHKRLRVYQGCIRWGGDYVNRPDAMHFEIDKTLSDCEKVARKLLDSPRGMKVCAANPGLREVALS